jgi:hypothetical protein
MASVSKPDDATGERPRGETAGIPRVALTREEAAAALGMSRNSFERYVQPDLRLIRRARMRLQELRRWAETAAERAL